MVGRSFDRRMWLKVIVDGSYLGGEMSWWEEALLEKSFDGRL